MWTKKSTYAVSRRIAETETGFTSKESNSNIFRWSWQAECTSTGYTQIRYANLNIKQRFCDICPPKFQHVVRYACQYSTTTGNAGCVRAQRSGRPKHRAAEQNLIHCWVRLETL